jgi:hypothetical protein
MTLSPQSSRRDFVKKSGVIATAATALATRPMHVHAAENNTLQVALVGCGGRGTGWQSEARRDGRRF